MTHSKAPQKPVPEPATPTGGDHAAQQPCAPGDDTARAGAAAAPDGAALQSGCPDGSAATSDTTSGATLAQISALPDAELIARYRQGLARVDARLVELSDEEMDMAFLPDAGVGRWPIRVLVGHRADSELAFTHRMRRAVAEDNPVFSAWDVEAFIDAGLYADGRDPVAAQVAVIHTLRRWTAQWALTLSREQWQRQGLHPERGPETVREILARTTWHLEHHARFLNAKICRLLGPAPAAESQPQGAAARGGCGPACGCRGG